MTHGRVRGLPFGPNPTANLVGARKALPGRGRFVFNRPMAVDLPGRTRELPAASGTTITVAPNRIVSRRTPKHGNEPKDWPKAAIRVLEVVPGALALFLISALIWGYVWFPLEAAL